MPMSSSCVVNRGEVLVLIDALDEHIQQALQDATRVNADREEILRRARDEAELIVSDARSRRDDLVSDSEVFRLANSHAEKLVSDATEEAQMLRRDTDDYVEGRLAALETSLQATLEVVTRGRSRLRGRNPIEDTEAVDIQELYVYDGVETDADEDEETRRLVDDLLDLEPLVRDAVVLALPFKPVCADDCGGLCPECGTRLSDDPDHAHEAPIDPRWAALQDLDPARDE
jgi:uncharacterized protein